MTLYSKMFDDRVQPGMFKILVETGIYQLIYWMFRLSLLPSSAKLKMQKSNGVLHCYTMCDKTKSGLEGV